MAEERNKHRKYWLLALFAIFIAMIGIVLPEIEPTPLTYINASSIQTTGATATGSLQNITDINHGYYNVSEINAQPWYVVVNFTNITNFSFLEVKAKYFSTSATPSTHVVDLEIFCKTDQEYEDLFFLENAAEWRYFTRHFPDSEHFIDAQGNVSIKFNHSSNGNVNHRMLIDVVRLAILPQYAQNTVTLNQFFNTTTTGGAGVSNLSNLTIDANKDWMNYSITNVSLPPDNTKVNKSGDTMTGTLNMSNKSINDINYINNSVTLNVRSATSLPLDIICYNNACIPRYYAYNNASTVGNYFIGIRSRGNITSPLPILKDDILFNIAGAGVYDTSGSVSGSSPYLQFITTENWNSTNRGTEIRFAVTKAGGTAVNVGLTLKNDSNVTISGLSGGTGNAYVCVNKSTGTLYVGNPGC